jgi:hypothetical protein
MSSRNYMVLLKDRNLLFPGRHWRPGPRACPGVLFRRTRLWLKATGEWRDEGSSLDLHRPKRRQTPTPHDYESLEISPTLPGRTKESP